MTVTVAARGGSNNGTAKPAAPAPATDKPATSAARGRTSSPVVHRSPLTTPRGGAKGDTNLDNFEDRPAIKPVVNSPRSVQFSAPGVPHAVAKMRYEHYEGGRCKKLEMLRAERAALPEPAAVPEPAEQPKTAAAPATRSVRPTSASAARQPSPAARPRQTATATAARPSSAPAPARRAATPQPQPRPATPSRQASPARPLSPAAQQRAQAIVEANAKRAEAKKRATELAKAREAEAERKQHERDARSQKHVRALLDKKVTALEVQRLRRDDAMDRVKQLGRIKQYNTDIRAAQWEQKIEARRSDPFSLLAAREDYRTPRQRIERARSASNPRSSSQQ